MLASAQRRSSQARMSIAYRHPSVVQSTQQSLLAALADLDVEYEGDLETVRKSSADDWLKQIVIRTLQERYQEQQTSYVQQLARLRGQLRQSPCGSINGSEQ
jgi:hypothetical protein